MPTDYKEINNVKVFKANAGWYISHVQNCEKR